MKVGDDLPSFRGLWRFFDYFHAMQDTAGTLRYVDHKDQVHHVSGSFGGQQGDPLEIIRFCTVVHPVWGRVMSRFQRACAFAFADDVYIHSEFEDCLLILTELKPSKRTVASTSSSKNAKSSSRTCRSRRPDRLPVTRLSN